MTISLPSKDVHNLDVSEIKNFSAKFRYNFFTTDESLNDTDILSTSDLRRKRDFEIDFSDDAILKRIPRFVELSFNSPFLSEFEQIDNSRKISLNRKNLIKTNLDKIISEDNFSSNSFMTINFNDSEIEDKLYRIISGSLDEVKLNGSIIDDSMSNARLIKHLSDELGEEFDPTFLSKHYANLERSASAKFYSTEQGTDRVRKMSNDVINNSNNGKIEITSDETGKLRSVNANVQFNTKFIQDIFKNQLNDPSSLFRGDSTSLFASVKLIYKNTNMLPTDEDYKMMLPIIDLKGGNASQVQSDRSITELIGYIVDKHEIISNTSTIEMESLIIESSNANKAIDFNVKYGGIYKYQIRAIYMFTLPAVDNDTGEIATVKALVSSKPTHPVYVSCVETQAPPVPNDPNFIWNYETEKLMVSWNMPVNTQRDIKQFQVFRRNNLNEPFELLKVYDFDDSLLKLEFNEVADELSIEFLSSPKTFWIDDDFQKGSNYIYAVTSIDAHGFSSGYSAQFKVSFDVFKNKIVKTFVSHSGAPKPYPNLYVDNELFVDAIKTSGSSQMKLIFNPEYYELYDKDGKFTNVISTKQNGGSYSIQILNLDNQKSDEISLVIDDQRDN